MLTQIDSIKDLDRKESENMGRWKGIIGREKIYNNLFTGVGKDTAPKQNFLNLCKKKKPAKAGFSICSYSSEIAPAGQVPAHEPQEIQVAASISNLPSPSLIAPTGQEPAQAPQDTQLSEITNAIIISSFYTV